MISPELISFLKKYPKTPKMPALFVGHGSPMHGIEDSVYARAWGELGKTLPTPTAIMVISAHWLTEGTFVHVGEYPETIHDFFGFPEELYALTYPAPGSPLVAEATQKLISQTQVKGDHDWGLDHGAWIVLHRMYPKANIPVFQMSIDMTKHGIFHYELGKSLRELRNHGVLILGSGNIVHNLGLADFRDEAPAIDWAERFDIKVANSITNKDHDALIAYETLSKDAQRSVPSPDHYFPLLYILGLQEKDDVVTFPIEGIDLGSISMRSVLIQQVGDTKM